jgi:hypothetical protein
MSLGGISIEKSLVELAIYACQKIARQNILKSPPKPRKIAVKMKRLHDVEMLALGKESLLARIAEARRVQKQFF